MTLIETLWRDNSRAIHSYFASGMESLNSMRPSDVDEISEASVGDHLG